MADEVGEVGKRKVGEDEVDGDEVAGDKVAKRPRENDRVGGEVVYPSNDVLQFYSKSADADTLQIGKSFRRQLSNFALVPGGFVFEGIIYPTVEHAYQRKKACYCTSPGDLYAAQALYAKQFDGKDAAQAKKAGSKKGMREMNLFLNLEQWSDASDGVMKGILQARYDADENFRKILEAVASSGKTLVHFSRGDHYWGGKVVPAGKFVTIVGQNKLGVMLMDLAKENKL
jgi:ribA/ribD-fused uncharacterized protein